jgi:glutamate-5-semialdehyde dehydrogenase
MASAHQASANGELSQSVLKRLDLSRPGKYEDMLKGILDVRDLPDPIGKVDLRTRLDEGLELERVSCPIGVLLIIFEARPEVIANISALAIKSGNAAILKGGKESSHSFEAIARVISKALAGTEVPSEAIQLVKTRDVIDDLLALDKYIDLVIPRGGNELVRYVKDHTKIPVLGHADGLCSVYLHKDAAQITATAVKVVVDSKCDYPAACNAAETLLVHEAVLTTVLPAVAAALLKKGVSLRCDAKSKAALAEALTKSEAALLQDARDEDYATEFLDLIIAVKTVPGEASRPAAVDDAAHDPSLLAAIAHINAHSSHHTDCIVTSSAPAAEKFLSAVDSAGVYWNASTRFADGMRYGFGTEVGISTNKIHSRGPVGLEGLTIYKYKLRGTGQGAGEYGDGEGKRRFLHERMEV